MAKSTQQRLADLEELTLRIHNQVEKQFFDEAIQCYFIGALRASVILAWIVATDNLTSKLELLAKEDGEAKKRWGAIQAKREKDENFEEDLLNAFGPGALDIFDLRQLQQLQYVRRIRNWCAHATDYQPTPEEVRNCLRLLIDIALSVPTYRGYRYISQLSEQIKDRTFLPERDYKPVVSDIISKIRPSLYKAVTEKLVELAIDPFSTVDTVQNTKRFLGAMLQIINDDVILQTVVPDIKRLVNDAIDTACDVIAHHAEIARLFDFQERERLIRFLLNEGFNQTRQPLLEELIRIEFRISKEPESIVKQVEAKYHLVPNIIKEFSPKLVVGIYEQLIPKLEYNGFDNFAVNNEGASNLQRLGFEFFEELPDEKKIRLVRAIIEGAINGSNVPNALIDRAKTWSEDWRRILVTEFPLLLTTKKQILHSPSLVIDVLKASSTTNEPLPETWKLLLKVGEENKIDWYFGESWKLYESLENVNETFKEIGKPSPELEKFIADIVPF
jgi:hypothetical protein